MAHNSMIARERARREREVMQQANAVAYSNTSQSSSYSTNVNKASASSSQNFYSDDGSQNYARKEDDPRYYVEDDGPQQRPGEGIRRGNLEIESIPDDRVSPPAQGRQPNNQPTYQTKPVVNFAKKGNVRIVGGKLFHVEDDAEGPISIQFIGDHPDPGPRGYHVAKSTYPPPGKPRNATSAGGQNMHFIA